LGLLSSLYLWIVNAQGILGFKFGARLQYYIAPYSFSYGLSMLLACILVGYPINLSFGLPVLLVGASFFSFLVDFIVGFKFGSRLQYSLAPYSFSYGLPMLVAYILVGYPINLSFGLSVLLVGASFSLFLWIVHAEGIVDFKFG
jgi:hypothetical protein